MRLKASPALKGLTVFKLLYRLLCPNDQIQLLNYKYNIDKYNIDHNNIIMIILIFIKILYIIKSTDDIKLITLMARSPARA